MRYPLWLRFPTIVGSFLLTAALVGCEEANHDLADPPDAAPQQPVPEQPVTVDPVVRDAEAVDAAIEETDTDIEVDLAPTDRTELPESRAETREERREERRERVREALDDVNVDVDGEGTDVQIGNGEINVEAE